MEVMKVRIVSGFSALTYITYITFVTSSLRGDEVKR
jgi:hypothetical protein